MPTAMTYNSLLTDVRRYLERGFTLESDKLVFEQLPSLINNAERRIARELKLLGLLVPVTTTLPAGTSTLAKPDRWRMTTAIRAVGLDPILPRSYDYCRTYWPDPAQTAATVEFYADYDYDHWLFVPTPTADVQLDILYYELPVMLDDSNQTNWLTAQAPNLLLYAALLEATPFLKNDERIPVWEQMYTRAGQGIATEDQDKITDRATQREAP